MIPTPKFILVLAPNWLGDAVMCTSALRALRQRYPDSEITVAAQGPICQLLEDLPVITRCIALPKRPSLSALIRLGRYLAPFGKDLCVVFPHSFRTALLARLTGARQRLGYARGNRSFLLTKAVQPHREAGKVTPIYMAREYESLLSPLGCEDDGQGLELGVPQSECEAVSALLEDGRPKVGFAPGAAFGPSKCWPAERYAAVANALAGEANAQCILLTGPGEEATRAAFLGACQAPIIECQGTPPTIARLKATISQLDLLVGNDSGPRHIAIAFKKPVICIMGSTSPRYTDSPWEQGEVIRIEVPCGPCQKPHCPTGDHICMEGITPERVTRAALNWL